MVNSKSLIYKDKADKLWFVGVYSNNFLDKDDEYISNEAHEKYAKWLKVTGIKPPIVFMHQPQFPHWFHALHLEALAKGHITVEQYNSNMMDLYASTALAQTKTVINLSGFMLVIGEVLENKHELALKLKDRADKWGMSHGFLKLRNDGNIIDTYHAFEFTTAPKQIVANAGTLVSINMEEMMDQDVKMLDAEDRALLEEALNADPEDAQDAFEKVRTFLSKYVDSKTVEEEDVDTSEEEEEETDSYTKFRNQVFADLNVEGLSGIIKQLSENVKALSERVTQVEKTEDQKISEVFNPINWNFITTDQKDVEEEDNELLDQLKQGMSEGVVEEDAKAGDSNNALELLFWQNFKGN